MDNEKTEIVTKKIVIWGIVQGVGFRPFVFRCAEKNRINGAVRNIGGLVEIIAQSDMHSFNHFLTDLQEENIGNWEIVNLKIQDINSGIYSGFKITDSSIDAEVSIIPPDLSLCPQCRSELFKREDRRFKNSFISCVSCGPRYSIIESLPYDRETTSMKDFEMCPQCMIEYTTTNSRRFHAQTISCNDCGPYLILKSHSKEMVNFDGFEEAVRIINSGGIIAVKGIGGYHFACLPFNEETVQNLRKLKGREEKPFAVMFEDADSVRDYCFLSEEEERLLKSKPNPIVLLIAKESAIAPSVNKGSIYCGAFIPYTPLQLLLTKVCGPLIMTSANISDKPIIKDDFEMLSLKSPYLGGVLYNKRRIIRSVDDSVAKIIDNHPQLIRRSRGYVPYPVFMPQTDKNPQIFAAGGDLKATFCLCKNKSAVLSQYFGDLEESAVMDIYGDAVSNLSDLLKIKPDIAVCDMHPNYKSTKFAEKLGVPIFYVQHHHAHIASVMAEHHLKGRVIGVAFDGTGYGTDGNVWGGEFLVCEGADFKRAAHLEYTPILGGDLSMKDAEKTATCFLLNAKLDEYIKDERYELIKKAVSNNINTILSSSMGRLFDAVSAILEIKGENSFEGECAAYLEREAILAKNSKKKATKLNFSIEENDDIITISPKPLLTEICKLKNSIEKGCLALGFHFAVADLIVNICKIIRKQQNTNMVALSGGVFQNTIVTEQALKLLRENKFDVYYNVAVPPNDGGISFGQAFIGLMR